MDIEQKGRVLRISDSHARYERHLQKHFDVYFNAVIPNGRLADFSGPRLHTYRHNRMKFLLSSLPEEPASIAAYFRHLPKNRILAYDLGAYCGLSTYEIARRFFNVVAFEPDRANLRCLYRNMRRHQCNNVTVVPVALSGLGGKVPFSSESSLGSRIHPGCETVLSITLREAFSFYGVPDFIAMDIEGAEVEVLDLSQRLLRENKLSLAIDTNHEESKGWTTGAVERILKESGYHVETSTPGGMRTTWAWNA